MKVTFKKWDCVLNANSYGNGRLALTLSGEGGSRIAVATVNIPTAPLADGEVCIKDYSENEGMFAALVAAGVVEPLPTRIIPQGFVQVPVCKLTPAARDWLAATGM